jgi:hypothetical protein
VALANRVNIRGRVLVLALQAFLVGAGLGCGDPMLPSDYSGVPAATVGGNVLSDLPTIRNAREPAFSLEWLTGSGQSNPLVSQPLQFQRADRLHEWSIGVDQPAARARLDLTVAASDHVRFAVGKMVYFDDSLRDRRLDWKCVGVGCDQVKAVSAEFIVFVERPPTCQPIGGGPVRPRLAPGFHYYRFDEQGLREMNPGEPLSFVPTTGPLSASNPTEQLRAFAQYLIDRWRGTALEGC